MKMNKIFKTGAVAALALLALGCTEGDNFNPDRDIVLFSGTSESPMVKIDTDTYGVSVTATGKVSEDVTIYLKYDPSALEAYNATNKTNFRAVPESALSMENDHVVISKGMVTSNVTNVTVTNKDFVEEGYTYVVPLVLAKAEGGSCEILSSGNAIFLRLTNELHFAALDIGNANLSSNYIFDESKKVELSTYTYEIKFYANSLKATGTDMICRMCAWEAADESKANMLRFGENGYPGHSLQLVSPAGNIVSDTEFDTQKWYMLSLVYDGSTMTMYVDGVPEPSRGSNDGTTTFQRFEMGMSWGGYTSRQLFSGRICEMRLWNRALSVNEMKEGFCNVPADSEGLVAYWKFNEGEGHIFHDATGHGYDMDWSDTSRDERENGVMVPMDKSSIAAGQWKFDDINICRD